jgi:hypothetical protein
VRALLADVNVDAGAVSGCNNPVNLAAPTSLSKNLKRVSQITAETQDVSMACLGVFWRVNGVSMACEWRVNGV